MGRPPGWIKERTGRAPMRSPGRPGVNQREAEQAFWVRESRKWVNSFRG
jgi:hypothetical protein